MKAEDIFLNFDLRKIVRRVADGSYVVMLNGLPYHVPNHADEGKVFARLDAYAKAHPEVVTEEHPYVPTPKELAAAALARAKAERAALVEKATVTVDGMVFDADETSQNRLVRGIVASLALGLSPDETTEWTLADNSSAMVTAQQMARALLAAGQYQTSVWRMPYDGGTINE